MAKKQPQAAKRPASVETSADHAEVERILAEMKKEWSSRFRSGGEYGVRVEDCGPGKWILGQNRDTQAAIVAAASVQLVELEKNITEFRAKLDSGRAENPHSVAGWGRIWNPRWVLMETLRFLLRRSLPLTEPTLIRLLEWPVQASNTVCNLLYPLSGIATAVENFASSNEINDPLRNAVESCIERLRESPTDKDCRKTADRLQTLLAGGPVISLEPGEAWSDAALADLKKMKAKEGRSWNALLLHCQHGGHGKFTERWRTEVQPLLDAVGFEPFKEQVLRWFPLVDKPRTIPSVRQYSYEPDSSLAIRDQLLLDVHVELLRGLVWCCGLKEDADLARAVGRLAISAYRKVPGRGPRLVSLGNACVTALGMMPGRSPIGQLAVLQVKIKFGTAQKEIEKAFNVSAEREGLPRDEIEELAVPSYGLQEVGVRRETFGEYQTELVVDGSTAALHWLKDGKPLKSAPASVKKEHPEEFKELQAAVKDVNAMLPAQRERIDTLFLARKTWPLAVWRERYLDHPLIGTIARRLLWSFTAKGKTVSGLGHGDGLVGVNGKSLSIKDPNWSDGGPGGLHRVYWESYSFGELTATARTRRELLERLVPRLRIADRCTFSDRFLIVRGDLRTYKIHLGSGNILMLPDDQYLCIVPKQTVAGVDRVFLPFEGDGTLSIILSKAFLLADDAKITDPTITNQLKK